MLTNILIAASALRSLYFPVSVCFTSFARGTVVHSVRLTDPANLRLHMSISGTSSPDTDSALEGSGADVWLKAKGVDFKIIEQSRATSKCRDSALERGISLRQIVKSIVFVEETSVSTARPRVLQAMLPGFLAHLRGSRFHSSMIIFSRKPSSLQQQAASY
jgi:hypothetical protein